ncbi:MAG: TagF domain-containing protein [Desulfovibrio sp.]|uniref:TagF domain-containing protein n=1 Tax=Desulfovibrio sp. 7SRBS1 TaxID=3378064 RepID=UPI003B40B221
MKPEASWRFAAMGKHPGAGDYIHLGDEFLLAGAMASWMGRAFDRGSIDPDRMNPQSGAMFWSKGGTHGELACGVLAPSWDSVGRPYPLMVVGNGPLAGWPQESWTDYWDLLPVALSATWQAMTEIACGRKGAVDYLQRKVAGLPAPHGDWLAHSAQRRDRLHDADKLPCPVPDAQAKQLLLTRGMLPMQAAHPMDGHPPDGQPMNGQPVKGQPRGEDIVWLWHAALKNWAGGVLHPEAALAWWNDGVVRLLLLRRPMVPADMKAMLYGTDTEETPWT